VLADELALVPGWPDGVRGKRLAFVRHAEGWHNKDAREVPNYFEDELGLTTRYWDASLTPEGEAQAQRLAEHIQRDSSAPFDLVAVSPMTRTLQTASIAFANASGARVPFVATSLARERVGHHACDGRRDRSILQAEFPHVDFGEIVSEKDEMWENKEGTLPPIELGTFALPPLLPPPRPSRLLRSRLRSLVPAVLPSDRESTLCALRAQRLLQWLWERPERHIAVVSHWVFLQHLFRPFSHHPEFEERFGNAELRRTTLVRRSEASGRDEL
jgi:broad specificity phosphatase PhoE